MSIYEEYKQNPVKAVYEMFGVDPDKWQAQALMAFASDDKNMQRISLQACAGPGKSAVLSWIALIFILCYGEQGEHPKGAALSMTHTNLMDNLWSEIYKWMRLNPFLMQNFKWTKDRLFAIDHPETWFISARSFSNKANKEERGRTLSGLHAKNILFLLDEGGSIPPEVGKAAEQALSNCAFGKICMAGNPTSHEGLLYEASKDPKWFKIKITGDPEDPMRSPRISKEWAQQMIDEHGRKDPWVQSMILGEFPEAAINTLLTDYDIDQAEQRNYRPEDIKHSEKRLGVDVARFGSDSSIILPRQGLSMFMWKEGRNLDGPMLANKTMAAMQKWGDVDKIFVDGTGGYGSSCIDFLKQAGVSAYDINFASQANEPERFFNKRSEMYWHAAQWIKKSGSIPIDSRFRKEATSMLFYYVGNKFKLEGKDQIKARLGFSPDIMDAFVLTFAMPEMQKKVYQDEWIDVGVNAGMVPDTKYNPLKR